MRKFIDIGVNLTDSMFKGIYGSSQKHQNDLADVMERAFAGGMQKMIITGGSLSESRAAIELARTDPRLFCTVGCHPTRSNEFLNNPDGYLADLKALINANRDKVVAVGECGLDYDREKFSPRDVQNRFFPLQCQLAVDVNLPLFLHCRAAHEDFKKVLEAFPLIPGGIVHTFDGSYEMATQLVAMGYYLGVNGCSLKTQSNLDVVKQLPLDRLLLETDAPWCEIRPTHAGYSHIKTTFPSAKKEKWQPGVMVKSRNEPVTIVQVLEVVAGIKEMDPDILADKAFTNTEKLFFPSKTDT